MLPLLLLAGASAEQILGSFVFQRHGDRLEKPTDYLTPIGTRQCQNAGQFFASRYLGEVNGLDAVYDSTQFNLMVPSADVLFKSMMSFTQGFFPPANSSDQSDVQGSSMSNGTTEVTAESLQYVMLDAYDAASADYWKVVATNACPKWTAAQSTYMQSQEFVGLNQTTLEFYEGLWQYVQGDFKKSKLNYANAYTVFDHFLTHDVHNSTFHELVGGQDSDVFKQIRYLSDIYSKGLNVHPNDTIAQIAGKTILGEVSSFLSTASNTSAPLRVQVLGGSYDQFYQLFAEMNMFEVDEAKYTGIVNYAASVAFELYQADSGDQYVRVGLRNGTAVTETDVDLEFIEAFGSANHTLSDFQSQVSKVAITQASDWCDACGSTANVCQVLTGNTNSNSSPTQMKSDGKLTLAGAGGIGAGVTIFVFLVLGLIAWLIMRRRRTSKSIRSDETIEGSIKSEA